MALGQPSIRSTLLAWLALGLTLAITLVSVVLYLQAREEANLLFDYQMQQVASALPRQFLAATPPLDRDEPDPAPNVVIQIWDPSGVRVYLSHDYADLPQPAVPGFSTLVVHQQAWRVYSARQGTTVVQIAQPLAVRRTLAARSALKTVAPLLLLVPFLGAVVWLAVRRGLAPIHGVALELASRDAGQLAPVSDAGLPHEILPLTNAVNDLFTRLSHAAATQRLFVDDAAHELRTPLTALKLQVSLAERAADAGARATAFAALHGGLDRAARLVHQLLTLARHEPGAMQVVLQCVDLAVLARAAVADLALQADGCRIDLGVIGTMATPVLGDPDALRILINNLLDNALRATSRGGRIDVRVEHQDQLACLTVDDTGPGIPESDLARVFDRFFRGAGAPAGGSGLGLAIVQRICELHHATIVLTNRPAGLRARVMMPLVLP